jgi:WYL domain
MGRRGQSVTLSISEHDKAQLEQIAQEQGMLWGDRPNISRLVEAIARRELLIGRNNDWSDTRIRELSQAIRVLHDTGYTQIAETIAQLLLERGELSDPMRREIDRYLETPLIPWRQEIDRYILRQQPFQLAYRDAVDRPWVFTIRYAKVTPHEQRQYLDCWCEQTDGNQDIPELAHNWCLRLDRIPEAAITPIAGQWNPSLDAVEVEMNFYRGLAFAYQAKPEDIFNEWRTHPSEVRRVLRRVTSTFWFVREVFRYGEECQVVAPASVRSLIRQKVQALVELYDT